MAKREIYFARNNQLFTKTVEVDWDADSKEVNQKIVSENIFKNSLPFIQPCVDVSSSSGIYRCKSLCTYYVKDDNGTSIHDLWEILDKHKDKNMLPPGSYDLIYLMNLTEEQIKYALSKGSFYDIYYNKKKKVTSSAKALAVLQLLYQQNKLDYIYDMNKFLHWYFWNGAYPVEWTDYEINCEENLKCQQRQ